MIQAFDSPAKDNFKPLHLDNYAQGTRANQTNFLTFNKPTPSYKAVEFASGSDASGHDWAVELDDTFAKPGVFKFRYEDVANPIAAGHDYNIDMGGKNIFKLKPGSASVESMNAKKNKQFMGMPVKGRKEKAAVADYVLDTVGADHKYDNEKPAQYGAYKEYGYKEMGISGKKVVENQKGAKSRMMMRDDKSKIERRSGSRESATALYQRDVGYCQNGKHWVDGHCVDETWDRKKAPICPYGWEVNADGKCQLEKKMEGMHADVSGRSTFAPNQDEDALDRAGERAARYGAAHNK
jgi:hypothetical protein